MPSKIQLNVYENNEIIDTIENVTLTDPIHLIQSLEEFRQIVNEKLTQRIADDENFEDYNIEEELSNSENEDEENLDNHGSPKKRKT